MRILLVDDDENLMESLAERLIRQRYAVDIAVDGSSAATYVDLFEYDLIVLDLMLPDGDGIAFCRAFRKQGYANPLMILTAKESTQQKVKALDAGADDYVVKPFDFDELCARIRALLRREHQGLPPVLSWGALSLDPSACETTYQGQLVRLTPKEFSLMELFLRHPHRVYSLGAIIDDLWSFDDPPGEDAVRTHIKGLRRKLQKVGAPKDLIKTVYGLGYRLNENAGWISETGSDKGSAQPVLQPSPSSIQETANQSPEVRSLGAGPSRQKTVNQSVYLQVQPSAAARMTDSVATGTRARHNASEADVSQNSRPVINQPVVKPSAANAEETLLAGKLSDAYHRYLIVAGDQIATLETVAAAVKNRSLDAALYAAGCACAHKLVGSLDSFGIARASQVARKIETHLQDTYRQAMAGDRQAMEMPLVADGCQLSGWIAQLRDRIDQATATNLAKAIRAGLPTVLVVSQDALLTQQLFLSARQADLQVQVVASYQQANDWLAKASFNLVVCDAVGLLGEAAVSFLTTLRQAYALPVVVLGEQLPLNQRLELAQQGVTIVSDRTQPPAQIINILVGTLQAKAKHIKIAIADDDPEMLSLFQSSLKPWGFQVTSFTSATELWHWLNNESGDRAKIDRAKTDRSDTESPGVDGLVLDIEMPQLNGIELCQILRADVRFQSMPILFLTGHTESALRIQAYQAGADDVIHKAVAPAELATRLHNQLSRVCRL
ncbi:MAG: response regulator [Cyanobacteria bacterium J06560_6]